MAGDLADVLILGAGIAGCALAYHLTKRQGGAVVVYDPRTPGAGASGRAAGIVTEQLWDRWDVDVARESARQYAELAYRWEPDAYRVNGFARWTSSEEVAPVLTRSIERLRDWGVRIEEATPDDLARWLPAGRFDDVRAAVIARGDACVIPSSLTTIFAEGARQGGALVEFGQAMRSLRREGRSFAVELPHRTLRARRLVVAAGAWSKALLRELGAPLPLVPYRTQAGLLRPPAPAPDRFPSGHDLDLDVYLRPEANGRILAGNGTEKTEADPERFVPGGDATFLTHLGEALARRFPGWAESEVVSSWAGVCTATPDRRPLIGPVPGVAGLYVVTGFNGFGVMRAGGAALRLADLLAEGDEAEGPRAALGPVWPGRFAADRPDFLPKPGFTLEGGNDPRF